jgi:transcriptional regulator with GAF, ATPase, and Fis domain
MTASSNNDYTRLENDLNKLMHLIQELVSIRKRDDLAKVIRDKIKPILDFDDAVILMVDKLKKTSTHFLNIATEERKQHPFYMQIVLQELPLEGSPLQQICSYPEDIHYMNVTSYLHQYPEYPALLLMQQTDLHHSLSVKLRWGGDMIGVFMLHFCSKRQMYGIDNNLIKAVGNQVAAAVANILATEEVIQREKEKTVLLSISEAINTIRRKEDLLHVISEKIKPLFTFNDVVIALVNADNKTHRAFLLHAEEKRRKNISFKPTAGHDYPVADGVFDQVVKAGGPVIFDVYEAKEKYPLAGYLNFIYASGIQEMVSMPIRYSPNVTGVLILQSEKKGAFFEKDFNLLQAISDQLAVAVANILITAEMIRNEKEKSLQLSIIQHLTTAHSWEQRFEGLSKELQKKIPFRFAYFSCERRESQYGYGHGYLPVGNGEYQYVNKDHFLTLLHLQEDRFMQLVKRGGDNKKNEKERFPILKLIADGLELPSRLLFTYTFSEYGFFYFSLFNNSEKPYRQEDQEALHRIMMDVMPNIEKELHSDEIIRLKEKLEHEKIYLADEIKSTYNFDEMIGASKAIYDVYEKINQVARANVTVLITGETGTGKELLARAIHNYSDRRKNVMVKINCAVLPPHLVESELFGHERGAFTGALERRLGKFEIANGSSLFLDEIGELSPDLQAKLLRVLQEKEFERLGSNKVIKTDVRIVAATNRNLEKEVMEGRFRKDLYYRLAVFPIEIPPLRERKEDVPLLARHFIDKYNRKFNKAVTGFTDEVMNEMQQSQWPGNIREMEHLIERAVMLCNGKTIGNLHLNKKMLHRQAGVQQTGFVVKSLAQSEKEHILSMLKFTNGRIRGTGGAAELLNIKPTTLEARMKKLGVEKKFSG